MADIIKMMRESNNDLLKSEAEDISKWKNLKHNKEDIELFLNYNIAELRFLANDKKFHNVICTSNTTLIKLLSIIKEEDKSKTAKFRSSGIHTKNIDSIMTWDLVDNKMKTISLKAWSIVNFITINEDNILILDKTVNDILKK